MSPTGSTSSPMMTRVAKATRSTPSVLETKGKERETRTLHSMTFSWSSWGREERSGLPRLGLLTYLPDLDSSPHLFL